MSEPQKKNNVPKVLNTQNMRPASRKDVEDNKLSSVNRTDSLRPPELSRPVVVPTPAKRSYDKPIFLNEPTKDIPSGCFMFMSWMVLQLEVVGTGQHIRITPTDGKTLIIGRNPETAPEAIDIDLTSYVDSNDGVSRVHAAIKLDGMRLELEDKNSTNGTSINGLRFNPGETHPIRSGDIIMLGQFQMLVQFTIRLQASNDHDTGILPPLD